MHIEWVNKPDLTISVESWDSDSLIDNIMWIVVNDEELEKANIKLYSYIKNQQVRREDPDVLDLKLEEYLKKNNATLEDLVLSFLAHQIGACSVAEDLDGLCNRIHESTLGYI